MWIKHLRQLGQGRLGLLSAALPGVLLTLAAMLNSPPVRAWGAMQHEIAAQIGAAYLSDVSRQRIRDLLGDESLADASTWADRMRDNPAPFWQEEAGPYHYVTVPPGRRYDHIGPPRQGDAVTALAQFAADLRDPGVSRGQQQLALRFAIHIIQDLQQPLHVGNGRDRGGNDVVVQVHDEPSNLHRLWDRQIFESTRRSQQDWVHYFEHSGLLRKPQPGDEDPMVWIAESAALRDSLYPVPRRITAAYYQRELPRAERRLALAGIRMAAWLNATLDDDRAIR